MKTLYQLLSLLAVLAVLSRPALTDWPTTIRENLPLSTDPQYVEDDPFAFPYPEGKTCIVWYHGGAPGQYGYLYQMVDREGNFQYPEPQLVWPAFPSGYVEDLHVFKDDQGAVIICWSSAMDPPGAGQYAQKIDSLGNLCWGDSAALVVPNFYATWSIGPDGQGGIFFSYQKSGTGDLYAQHVNAVGQRTWGDSGLVVCNAAGSQSESEVTHDGQGGAYVVWKDQRPPYGTTSALFMQRLDPEGNPLWMENGVYLAGGPWFMQVLPDGHGGFLLHTNCGSGGDGNSLYRIGPEGRVLWLRQYVSWNAGAQMVPGESGFVYLGFQYDFCLYGQRIDLRGRLYWPTWSSGQVGAPIARIENVPLLLYHGFAHRDGWFYCMYNEGTEVQPYLNRLWLQALDPAGRRRWGINGVQFASFDTLLTREFNVAPDDQRGAVCVWKHGWDYQLFNDVWAKRVNADGSLGGPTLAVTRAPSPEKGTLRGLSGGEAKFTLNLEQPQYLSLTLYNIRGQEVARVFDGYRAAGRQEITLAASDLPSGVYFACLAGEGVSEVVKIVLLK